MTEAKQRAYRDRVDEFRAGVLRGIDDLARRRCVGLALRLNPAALMGPNNR